MDKIPITNIGFEKLEEELKIPVCRATYVINLLQKPESMGIFQKTPNIIEKKKDFIEGRIADLENKISREK